MTAPFLRDDEPKRGRISRRKLDGRVARDLARLASLAAEPGTVAELSRRWGMSPSAVRRWLEAREWLSVDRYPGTDVWRRRSRG